MRKMNKLISMVLTICLLTLVCFNGTIAFADEEPASSETVSAINDEMYSIDNSELDIHVEKQEGDTRTTIFNGKLKDFDNGRWVHANLSDIKYFIIFDWDKPDDKIIYVMYIGSQQENQEGINDVQDDTNNTKESVPTDEEVKDILTNNAVATVQSTDIKCDVNLMYDGAYSERIMLRDKQLKVPVRITNTSNAEKSIVCYIAEYDKNGKLIDLISGADVNVNAHDSFATEISKTFSKDVKSVKIFVWNSETLQPITGSIMLNESENDYYADTDNKAQLYDVQSPIKGSINTSDDVDYIKFIPEEGGMYTINCISASNAKAELYDSSRDSIKSDFNSCKASLKSNLTYYLKICGNIGDYVITIQKDVPKEADEFNIYYYDIGTNAYKKSILKMCKFMSDNSDTEGAKQMYDEYESILSRESALHSLPEFLSGHPKDINYFDEIVNQYYSTKYNELEAVRREYLALIDKYTDYGQTELMSADNEDSTEDEKFPIVRNYYPPTYSITGEIIEDNTEGETDSGIFLQSLPALKILEATSTKIKCNVTFPSSGEEGNVLYLVDFNTSDGLTVGKNVYPGKTDLRSGEHIIHNLKPGGIYIVEILWSTDGGETYGRKNSICRFVQLDYADNNETFERYDNGGRVVAEIEPEDKALAKDSEFNTWLDRMDKAYSALRELTGYTPYDAQKIIMKSTRDNLNEYFNDIDGLNYWTVTLGYYDYTRVFKHNRAYVRGHLRRLSKNDWGETPLHELSHVFDYRGWDFDSEALAWFKMYYICDTLNARIYEPGRFEDESKGWYTGEGYYKLLSKDRYLDSYANSFSKNKYASAGFAAVLINLQKHIGWEPFKKTFRYFSDLDINQIPDTKGEKLLLFFTKLKDYSGKNVFAYLSKNETKIIKRQFGIDLSYVEAKIPLTSGGATAAISAEKGSYAVYTFKPKTSGNYYVYTSPYSGSGISNDTCIEIYSDSEMTNMIASNDDYGGSRFSQVNVAMTENETYYIKVRHYNNGRLLAQINVMKNAPVRDLTIDEYQDIITDNGDYALFGFTPDKTGTYVFNVSEYNGGTQSYDTYIKLYDSVGMTKQIGNGEKKIIANLQAGNKYCLRFSGFMLQYARGRITVSRGQTLEFKKKSGGSYIYVNNPEKFIDDDIIYPTNAMHTMNNLIYRQEDISGTNTMYVTHSCSDYENHPTGEFYYDIDFENNTNSSITISIDKLNYLMTKDYGELPTLCYDRLSDNSEYSGTYTIPAKSHVLLFKDILNQALKLPVRSDNYYCLLGIFLDFKVLNNKKLTVNTLAAYDEQYLRLTTSSDGTLYANVNNKINYWKFVTYLYPNRIGERDINKKMKGIDRTGLAEINAEVNIAIDDSIPSQTLPIYMTDKLYGENIHNPKYTWITAINPWNDIDWGMYYALPSAMNSFEYDDVYNGKTGKWYFDFRHVNPNVFKDNYCNRYSDTLSGNELNNSINDTFIDYFKHQASIDRPKNPLSLYPLPNGVSKKQWQEVAMMMGEWGTTYTYDFYVQNNGDMDRNLKYMFRMSNYIAVKLTVTNLTTGVTQNSLRTVKSDKVHGEFIRQEQELFDLNIEKRSNYHITLSILNGVGVTGFDNWLELN